MGVDFFCIKSFKGMEKVETAKSYGLGRRRSMRDGRMKKMGLIES